MRGQYRHQDGVWRCGQVNILMALTDIGPMDAMEGVVEAHLRKGDALLFCDGLSHGASSRTNPGDVVSSSTADNRRFGTAGGLRAFAGTAPVTRASGRSTSVRARKVRNKRLGDACHWWAFAMLTKSAGARGHYDRRRAAGDHHNAALRNLANKLLGRMWWCLQHNQVWDEQAAWPHLITRTDATAA